VRTVLEN